MAQIQYTYFRVVTWCKMFDFTFLIKINLKQIYFLLTQRCSYMIRQTPTAKDIVDFSAVEKFCHLQEHWLILNYVRASTNFMVTPCINNIHHFNNQLTPTALKNVEFSKHFKINKTAPTCFGLQGNHHSGATIST